MSEKKNKPFKFFAIGFSIGTANVIPGVSGGTIALITGILERLLKAVKSINKENLTLFFTGKFKKFFQGIDGAFLSLILLGVAVAILSLARLLEFLFVSYPEQVWSLFFGLILASIYFVGKGVSKWSYKTVLALLFGAFFALALSFINPAAPNSNPLYLIICGAVSIASMILPGLSGSFVLMLMGNYELILASINNLDIMVLLPFAIGCILGLVFFANILSAMLNKWHDLTISGLTGFIVGSLLTIWPWKTPVYRMTEAGVPLIKDGEQVVFKYIPKLPQAMNLSLVISLALMVVGVFLIIFMEKTASKSTEKE